MAESADLIIVGAGTAGCVLANRLLAAGRGRIVVLESGGSDRHPLIAAPGGIWPIMRTGAFSFRYRTARQAYLDDREFDITRGRVLGGSSSTNGMVYSRGSRHDYARWARNRLPGWSYADVLPYFRKLETHPAGSTPYHGGSGPLRITRATASHALSRAFLAAAQQCGYALNEDTDGEVREGFGPLDLMTFRNRRCSTADAYLRPVLSDPDLRVIKRGHVLRVLFDERQVRGVVYLKAGRQREVLAPEIILCCGAIESPHLLMLSGIGPARDLRDWNLPVICDAPEVGQGLQDHVSIALKCAVSQPITLLRHRSLPGLAQALVQYLAFRRGPLANPGFEVHGFVKSRADLESPDLRLQLVPALLRQDKRGLLPMHGFQIRVSLARPTSRGSVRLSSANPLVAPSVDQNYLSEATERQALRAAVRLMRRLWSAPAFDVYRGRELAPGPGCTSDADIDAYVRGHADPDYHSVGTCRMGSDFASVVDPEFRVRGVSGLRVVDASVMPSIVDAGTCVPTIMIAERAAEMMCRPPPTVR